MTTEQQARERKVLDAVPRGLYIDGSWRDASGGRELTVEDPATQESLCQVADASAADAAAALDAAASAAEASATWQRDSCVAGSSTVNSRPPEASRHDPSM